MYRQQYIHLKVPAGAWQQSHVGDVVFEECGHHFLVVEEGRGQTDGSRDAVLVPF